MKKAGKLDIKGTVVRVVKINGESRELSSAS